MSDILDMIEEWRSKCVDPYIASRRIEVNNKLGYKWKGKPKKKMIDQYLEVDIDNLRCKCGSKLLYVRDTTIYFCPKCDRDRIRISYDENSK
jgi:hypothetical protein